MVECNIASLQVIFPLLVVFSNEAGTCRNLRSIAFLQLPNYYDPVRHHCLILFLYACILFDN
ncbi:MAG: hypothetical protein IM577_00570 [Chitinophagaceae bacterium]|nr:hypothetical protein [Cytophagales bacterium]MCA6514066.1 hypothetical protein [Chitinophagaceae bacterium]